MKSFLQVVAIVALALLVAGCCNCRSGQKKVQKNLIGTEWQLIQLGEKTVQPKEGAFNFTLLADDNRFAGVGACNRLGGKYETADNGVLKIGPIASTMMACPDMKLEAEYLKALENTTHYDIDGQMLLLMQGKDLLAVFQAKP